MYKIYHGVIKKVPTDKQFEQALKKELDLTTIELKETIRVKEVNNNSEVIEFLPFRISYQDVDYKGNEKYILNEDTNEYEKSYRLSPIINAYGKELRIISELAEFTPVKVVVEEQKRYERTYFKLVCIQNLLHGKI